MITIFDLIRISGVKSHTGVKIVKNANGFIVSIEYYFCGEYG
jgi:hypothetical protein